jgi:hypothetical protein
MTMNRKAALKRLQQLEAEADPITFVYVHELIETDKTDIEYIGTNSRGYHVWHTPPLGRDSFGKILDQRFDMALNEQHFRPQPLHIIFSAEQANE